MARQRSANERCLRGGVFVWNTAAEVDVIDTQQTVAHRTAFRRCPRCGSRDVRRSAFLPEEEQKRSILYSPYRCKECSERFWVISGKARRAMIWILVLIVLMIGWAAILLLVPAKLPR